MSTLSTKISKKIKLRQQMYEDIAGDEFADCDNLDRDLDADLKYSLETDDFTDIDQLH